MEMGRRTSMGFPEVKGQDYKSTGTLSSKKRRKFDASECAIGGVVS